MDYKAYRQKMADSGQTADQWHREADNWFDGSVESVERRLAMCNLLVARSQEAVARDLGSHKHLAALNDLQRSQRYLQGLRADLLTASQNKTAAGPMDAGGGAPAFSPPDPPPNINESLKGPWREDVGAGRNPLEAGSLTHGLINGSLRHADVRWIALEGAKFHRAHAGVDTDELLIRAKNYAELKTSTRSVKESKSITSAFVEKVAKLAEATPKRQVRVAALQPHPGPDEVLFM